MGDEHRGAGLAGRSIHRHAELRRLLAPRSIAIVGASTRAGSFGERILGNLKRYTGRIFLVNARYEAIGEHRCYPGLSDLPEVPDCAVLVVNREAVEPVIEECVRLKVGGAIVHASGYAETGRPERIAQQESLGRIARESGLRIVGPNCLGIVDVASEARITFSATPDFAPPRPDAIGLISQSGALGFALSQAVEHGTSFSHILTGGNFCDVDVADYVAYLADDPRCAVIACVFEGMADPLRLIDAAQIARAAGKPMVVYKLATGEQGAAAAMSHTGSLAGSEAAYRAAFARAGIVVVDDFEALLETAAFFAKAPRPKADGVAVLATSGGAAIMAADKAELHGVPLPQPVEAVRDILQARIPEFGSARNPCDVTAQILSDPESLTACAGALLGDPTFGALVVPHPFAYDFATPRIRLFSALAREHGKIACTVWINEWLEGPGAREAEADPCVALFRSMDRCFATLAHWHARERRVAAGERAYLRRSPVQAQSQAAALLDAAHHSTLTEREAKAVLAAYGVPVVGEYLATEAGEAADAAAQLGFPVALKVESPDLPHKTEAGVIRLNLRTPAEVEAAFATVMSNAGRVEPPPRVNGVLVQPMVPPGVEIMVGARIDPLFGPLVVVGMGGVMVELLKDSAVALAPVTHAEARAMLDGLKGSALLAGFRGAAPVDRDRLAEVICRLSEFAADQRDRITELDVNPLICSGNRIVAVDALIVRKLPSA